MSTDNSGAKNRCPTHAVEHRTQTHPDHAGDLTAFQQDILVILADGERYGLAIKRALEALYDTDEINHGRLYPNLDQLADAGLVEKTSLDKRTNSYALTEAGERAVNARLKFLVAAIDDDDPVFSTGGRA